ncbi:MAG: hypothetical protein HC804_03635 [Anaerolineae bacterium]|nr:hypothetical protein [Anaerolineae bacterium]
MMSITAVATSPTLPAQVLHFVESCRLHPDEWRFASTPGGAETLYGSSFACMLLHYLGELAKLTAVQQQAWAAYLNSWQDPQTGYFLGPELVASELTSRKHSWEHVSQHLAVHVLPALGLLGEQPTYPLTFAYPFMDLTYLQEWLDGRDWHDAWLEGNNLLFVGQFLIHLRDIERQPQAQAALDLYFDWLDKTVDPATGLWGSNGYCSNAVALYGGYHQLLVYYTEQRPVTAPDKLVDVALSLQHADGGFHPYGGGGACEDTDAIDILVNMYKQSEYKRPQIRLALRHALHHIQQRQMADGGFVYRLEQPFIHMGVAKTASPANQSNLFSTWFRVHTLALMSEILTDEELLRYDWGFNDTCSMGWHRAWDKQRYMLGQKERQEEQRVLIQRQMQQKMSAAKGKVRRAGGKVKRRLLGSQDHA